MSTTTSCFKKKQSQLFL